MGNIRSLSASVWAMSIGTFVTLYSDGLFRIAATGTLVTNIDPATETFVADSVVRRLANSDGSFTRRGATCSPARLAAMVAAGSPDGKRPAYVMTLEELLSHKVFGAQLRGITAEMVAELYED